MIDLEWPGGPNGRFCEVARSQSFQDFRENGAAVDAPEDAIKQLNQSFGGEPTDD